MAFMYGDKFEAMPNYSGAQLWILLMWSSISGKISMSYQFKKVFCPSLGKYSAFSIQRPFNSLKIIYGFSIGNSSDGSWKDYKKTNFTLF